eukprot:6215558-Amphidinium_carterae.1
MYTDQGKDSPDRRPLRWKQSSRPTRTSSERHSFSPLCDVKLTNQERIIVDGTIIAKAIAKALSRIAMNH